MVATIATIVAPTAAAVYQVLLGQAGGSCVKHKEDLHHSLEVEDKSMKNNYIFPVGEDTSS